MQVGTLRPPSQPAENKRGAAPSGGILDKRTPIEPSGLLAGAAIFPDSSCLSLSPALESAYGTFGAAAQLPGSSVPPTPLMKALFPLPQPRRRR